ncbi:MAG: TatD family hydrolase [Clostridia bacterium]|nr:TatD family hydrolase [Clostridia bacterium]
MFDTHAHYCDHAFDEDREELLSRLFGEQGVTGIIEAGCDIEGSEAALALASKYPGMYAAVGFHPEEVKKLKSGDIDRIKALCAHPKAVAIGEIGLDYHYGTDNKEEQKALLREQLALAAELGKPVVIHERDCIADCVSIVFDYPVKGVFHSYSGSKETAAELIKRGWYISFSGTVTFKNARTPVENAAFVPEDRILTETDCPYLTAHPYRGKRNDSGYMRYTIARLAEIRGTDFEHIERITTENAKRLFGIG